MEIDWFIFSAQITNFLILLWLLQRFLYDPITRTMHQRQQKIKATLDEAEEKRQQAELEAANYRLQNQQFQQQHQQMLAQLKQEVEFKRQQLLKQVRLEVDESQQLWFQAIHLEREQFLRNLRQRTSEEISRLLRRALADLANAQLEQQIVNVFLERLEQSDFHEINQSIQQSGGQVTIACAFEITPEQRQELLKVIAKQIDNNITIKFETMPDLICGIELTTESQSITWNLESYLQSLEASLSKVIEQQKEQQDEPGLRTAHSSP